MRCSGGSGELGRLKGSAESDQKVSPWCDHWPALADQAKPLLSVRRTTIYSITSVHGKYFRLNHTTIAAILAGDKVHAVLVPTDAIIQVVDLNKGTGMVDVLWDGRTVEMFAVDVEKRGTEIEGNDESA